MNARFFGWFLAVATFTGSVAPSVAAQAITWIQKTAGSFSCYVPASNWQVVGNKNGIDISSPTGDEEVSYAQTAYPAVLTTQSVASQLIGLFEKGGTMSNASIVASSAATPSAAGTVQKFSFQGIHHWVNGTEPIVGYMYVTIVDRVGVRGFITSLVFAPTTKAAQDAAMLEYMRGHISFYNS